MKVLLIHNFYKQAGGEDRVFYNEMNLLRSKGNTVLTYMRHNREIESFSVIRSALMLKEAIWSLDNLPLRNLLRNEKPDLVHFHNFFPLISPSAYYLCQSLKIPVVQTLHNYRLLCPGAIFFDQNKICEECLHSKIPYRGIIKACYQKSRIKTAVVAAMLTYHRYLHTWSDQIDIYIVLSEYARQKFIEGGLPGEKIAVKPNFYSPDPGITKERERFILFAGRLSPEKGIRTLMESLRYLKSIPIRIVGSGPLLSEFKNTFSKRKSVEFYGQLSHSKLIPLMKKTLLLVFPSCWFEVLPMTIIEAFACGVPVIASRLGAMAELVDDGRTGLLFKPGDPEDLAAKIEWAWTHPKRMREMGKEARREYEEKYTAERNYQLLMDIYHRAIANKKAKG